MYRHEDFPSQRVTPQYYLRLFQSGEVGGAYDISILSSLWQDSIKTTPVTAYGDPVGAIEDLTGNGNDFLQAVSASRPTYGRHPLSGLRNQLHDTDVYSTESITVAAVEMTLSMKGTGTITLTGVSTSGPLVGTGVGDTVTLTFTPTAGTLTLTVSGSCTEAQLEFGTARTGYQTVDSTGFDVTEVGFADAFYIIGDGTDDFMEAPGTASEFKFMHNGLGSTFAGALSFGSMAVPDPDSIKAVFASRSTNASVGASLFYDDRSGSSKDEALNFDITDGAAAVIGETSANNVFPTNTPKVMRESYITQSGDDALVYLDNVEVIGGAELTTPSTADSTFDMLLFNRPTFSYYPIVKFYGCLFIDRILTDLEAVNVDANYAHKSGASL